MNDKPITIGLMDDQTIFRKALKYYLDEQRDMRVILQAAGAGELFGKLSEEQPEILLLDPFMPQGDGQEILKLLRSKYPRVKLVLVSGVVDISMIAGLMDMDIQGYLSKHDGLSDLLQLIQWVAQGRILRNKHLTDALNWEAGVDEGDGGSKWIDLDEREKRVLQLIWDEKDNKEIAGEFYLSVKSIEKIRQDLKIKLGVRSTIGLLKYAMKRNIIRSNIDNISLRS